jgi:hypothetical protein
MHPYINKKVLITTDRWFYAPNGKQYRAAFGTLKGVHEAGETLGFIHNRAHAAMVPEKMGRLKLPVNKIINPYVWVIDYEVLSTTGRDEAIEKIAKG